MKIGIVGAGAMGCLYGAKLSEVDSNEVYLLDVWQEHIDEINVNGLIMEEQGELLTYSKVKATSNPSSVGIVDLAVIFVKSTLTETAMETNKAIFGPETIAITLQNGLGNADIISLAIGAEKVLAGTTAHGATLISPGKIKHAGTGKTILGELTGEITERAKSLEKTLNSAGLEAQISDNVLGLVWDKLIVNVGINALTGITRLENGKLLHYPEIEELLELAVEEATQLAEAKGIQLSTTDTVKHTKEICVATSENRSSMLQDVLNGKQTEIDMINGAIVREAKTMGMAAPTNLVLTNLIKFIQRKEK
jgi:2-dehydropantoate 2-reductase